MKIIKHGYYSNNITIECRMCHCIYELESRDDWKGEYLRSMNPNGDTLYYDYIAECPECGRKEYFGMCDYTPHFLSKRPDFHKKYSMPVIKDGKR